MIYKLTTISKNSDFSIGFHQDPAEILRDIHEHKDVKIGRIFHTEIYLKDVFGFAEFEKIDSYGLMYLSSMQRNPNTKVVVQGLGEADAADVFINDFGWYVPQKYSSHTSANITTGTY